MNSIKKIGVLQTSKVIAIVFFIISAILMLPIAFVSMGLSPADFGSFLLHEGWILALMPVFYGVFGFIGTALFCFIYNHATKWVGEIEIEIADSESEEN